MSVAVFGYGSLVSPESASLTLGRPVEPSGPVRLRGWRRRWSQIRNNREAEKTFAPAAGDRAIEWVLGLTLEPDPGAEGPNGALLELSDEEAARLDVRELRYDRVDVTASVAPEHGFERVLAYVAKPAHRAPSELPAGAVILSAYVETVEQAFAELGPGQLELFRETTGPLPVDAVEAVLARDEIPPGNPTRW